MQKVLLFMDGGSRVGSGGNAAVHKIRRANTAVCSGIRAIYGGDAAVFRGLGAICADRGDVYGGRTL